MKKSKKYKYLQMSIRDIVSNVKTKDIILDPVYQRGFVTDLKKQTGILECIKNGKFLPPILLRPLDKEDQYEVLDGKQRITTAMREFDRLSDFGSPEDFEDFKTTLIDMAVLEKMSNEQAFDKFLVVNESSVVIKRSEKILGHKNTQLYQILKNNADWLLKLFYPKTAHDQLEKTIKGYNKLEHSRYGIHDTLVRCLAMINAKKLLNINKSYKNFNTLIKSDIDVSKVEEFFKTLKKTFDYNLVYLKDCSPLRVILLSAAQINTKRNNPPEIHKFHQNNPLYFVDASFQQKELDLKINSTGGEQTNSSEYEYLYKKCAELDKVPRSYSSAIRHQLKEQDPGCVICGSLVGTEVDHIFPYSKGGDTTLSNAQLLCSSCNKQKGNS